MATAAIMMGEMNGQQLLQAEHSSVLLIFLMSKFFNDFQSICARRMLSKRSINPFFYNLYKIFSYLGEMGVVTGGDRLLTEMSDRLLQAFEGVNVNSSYYLVFHYSNKS